MLWKFFQLMKQKQQKQEAHGPYRSPEKQFQSKNTLILCKTMIEHKID